MTQADLDRVRRGALDQIDKSRRQALGFLVGAAIFEGLLFIAVLIVIDFGDRTQLLIFLCACLVYSPLAFGLFALRSYMDLTSNRVLAALEAVSQERGHHA